MCKKKYGVEDLGSIELNANTLGVISHQVPPKHQINQTPAQIR